MAMSKCLGCGGTMLELVTGEPRSSRYKLSYVQRSSCGGVVGVLDYHNIGHAPEIQAKAIKKIAQQVGASVDL